MWVSMRLVCEFKRRKEKRIKLVRRFVHWLLCLANNETFGLFSIKTTKSLYLRVCQFVVRPVCLFREQQKLSYCLGFQNTKVKLLSGCDAVQCSWQMMIKASGHSVGNTNHQNVLSQEDQNLLYRDFLRVHAHNTHAHTHANTHIHTLI